MPGSINQTCGVAIQARDTRLDALRGLFLVVMAAVHVPTPLSHALQEPLGFNGAAEGFIFLGACLAGIVYSRTQLRENCAAMLRRVWARVKLIYLVHIGLLVPAAVAALALAARLPPIANQFHDLIERPWGSFALLPLLLHEPPLFDILPLYVVLLSVTPIALLAARRWGWSVVLMASACVWLTAQNQLFMTLIRPVKPAVVEVTGSSRPAPFRIAPRYCTRDTGKLHPVVTARNPASPVAEADDASPLRWSAFNFLAWQLLWVCGLAAGARSLRRPIGRRQPLWLIIAAVIIAAAGLAVRYDVWPALSYSPNASPWMDKWTLGPLRLLDFAAWAVLVVAWNPHPPGGMLAPLALLGRNALPVFALHIPLVMVASTILQMVTLSPSAQTGIGVAVIVALFPWAAWLDNRRRRLQRLMGALEPHPVKVLTAAANGEMDAAVGSAAVPGAASAVK